MSVPLPSGLERRARAYTASDGRVWLIEAVLRPDGTWTGARWRKEPGDYPEMELAGLSYDADCVSAEERFAAEIRLIEGRQPVRRADIEGEIVAELNAMWGVDEV